MKATDEKYKNTCFQIFSSLTKLEQQIRILLTDKYIERVQNKLPSVMLTLDEGLFVSTAQAKTYFINEFLNSGLLARVDVLENEMKNTIPILN